MYAGVPLLLALFSRLGTGLAKRIGRVQTMVALKVVGIALLVAMALLSPTEHPAAANSTATADGDDDGTVEGGEAAVAAARPSWSRVALLVGIYLMRTGLMNCTYPLNTSILMDFVPKEQRARWTSLQSLVRFGWCGSAAAGGVLADKYGYSFTFLITAGVQAAATALQACLLPLVPRAEKPAPPAAGASAAEAADGGDGCGGGTPVPPSVSVTPLSAPVIRDARLQPPSPLGSIQAESPRAA